jgi:4a-hydroxytetrahydrobiopterin dehydratase
MNNDANRHAKNALVNILFFPGLGSLRSGRWGAGIGQLVFALTGASLVLVWCFKELSQYYGLMFGDEKPQAVGWIGVTGGILLGISWVWACVTSISLFREASKPAAVPPRLVPAPSASPETAEIRKALATLPNWKRNGQIISRTYEFEDFPDAMKFVNNVAVLAEQAQHHPDIDVRWNKVTLALTTHDAGGLTEKDFALARACDAKLLG